jgi:hypothetical protein
MHTASSSCVRPRSCGRPAGRLCGARRPEKLFDIRREGAGQFFENGDCGILQSPFETADIGPVDPSCVRPCSNRRRLIFRATIPPSDLARRQMHFVPMVYPVYWVFRRRKWRRRNVTWLKQPRDPRNAAGYRLARAAMSFEWLLNR